MLCRISENIQLQRPEGLAIEPEWSFYARMMLIIAGILLKGGYPGGKILMFIAFLASISYIIFAGCKQKGREAVKMAVYFILALYIPTTQRGANSRLVFLNFIFNFF
ncbi:MAG: hypothetical protein MJZ42_03350 [Bacteroidales bacterium]|nr:hypothetical protein [Bacteroidales bacterium]